MKKHWFISGTVLLILGVLLLLKKEPFCVMDFFLSFVNFAVFCFVNKKEVITMTDRERLIELLQRCVETLPTDKFSEHLVDEILSDGWIRPPCKVGDKVAVRALCECVETVPDNDECRYICPFEDDCECEECDNSNERVFSTEISSIFNNGSGWKVTFKDLCFIEAAFSDIGVSFFVGENAEQQAKEYAKSLKEAEREKNGS